MTSEGLGEMFEGGLQSCAPKTFRSCERGDKQPKQAAKTVSKDPTAQEESVTLNALFFVRGGKW